MSRRGLPAICVIAGTRPEIIKMAPVIRRCEARRIRYFMVDTQQHYDYLMSKVFFGELGLRRPKYILAGRSGSHAEETGRMMVFIERILAKERPGVVLVEGDTNTVLAGALAAAKLGIAIGHVEAGLRSFDRRMPEEINRVLTDHVSEYLFAPTPESRKNLLSEGMPGRKIFVVGNTIVDEVLHNVKKAERPGALERRLGFRLEKDGYVLATAHRPENVDSRADLSGLQKTCFRAVHKRCGLPIIYPIHPRARKMLERFNIALPEGTHAVDPVSYRQMIYLLMNARLVLTDSGGVQEESCILKVPCITVRRNTERPETVAVGANVVVGADHAGIPSMVDAMLRKRRAWPNPYGDGRTAERIVNILLDKIGRKG